VSAVALALLGFGVSLAIPSLLAMVVGAAPPELAGIAGGALNASRQTGAALGVAVLGAVSATSTAFALATAAVVLLAGAVIAVGQPRQAASNRVLRS
jgi:DHA2 family methylenomycin A resistance protein-like MFS transporter